MERGVGRLVLGAGVAATAGRQLDPAEIFYVCALIQLGHVTRGRVADEEADRAAAGGLERAVAESVDYHAAGADRVERDRDVEVVAVGVERQKARLRLRLGAAEKGREVDAVAVA